MLHIVDSEKTHRIEEMYLLSSFFQNFFTHRLLLYSISTELCIAQSRKNTSVVNGCNSHRLLFSGRTEHMEKVEGCPWGTGMRKDLMALFQLELPCRLGLGVGMLPRFWRVIFLLSSLPLMAGNSGLGAEPAWLAPCPHTLPSSSFAVLSLESIFGLAHF